MTGNIPFLMKDVVVLAVSFYLLKQDVLRVAPAVAAQREWRDVGNLRTRTAEQVATR